MRERGREKNLPAAEVSMFCRQVAMILKSGIPLYDGIEVLSQNYSETGYGEAFEKIYAGVRDGGTLYEGVKAAGFFPGYMVHMIQVGEMSGKLDNVLEALGDYYEREDRLLSSAKNAIVYPMVLSAMMAAVIGILVVKVLPVFTEVFESLGTDLSGASAAVLSGGVILGKVVLFLVIFLLAAVLILFLMWNFGSREKVFSLGSSLFPPLRRLLDRQSAQRFADVVFMVLSSGYSLENALELIPDLLPDEKNVKKARRCRELMEDTGDFTKAVEGAGIFEPLYLKMIRVGASAGQTDQVMKRIAGIYATEVEDGIQTLVSWIEPALVGVLTLAIGGILLSVMLPLISIMTSLG